MKTLIIVNGTMGAGKTTVCRRLAELLPANVFLDGDWCWKLSDCRVLTVSLICSEEALRLRLQKDVEAGLRTEDVIERSVARLECYRDFPSVKLDVSLISPEEAAGKIAAMVREAE